MKPILLIESTTTNCSVGLFDVESEQIIASVSENSQSLNHAEQLPIQIEKLLAANKLETKNLVAVAVSKGPGSYTGLRVGTSLAKGLCMALSIPLIAVSTLEAMARSIENASAQYILPMLDARRMEVYSQLFNNQLDFKPETEVIAEVIDEGYFNKFSNASVVLVGPGASKLKELLLNFSNLELIDGVFPDAVFMASLAGEAFKKQLFEDIAYYEPFYLKDFIALKSTKNLLG